MKASGVSDYSVATIWLIQGHQYYLIDLVRGRFDFPELKQRAISLKEQYPHSTILVEDKASGTSLIQELRRAQITVIAVNPDSDKERRLYSCQPEFESGAVFFPAQASWVPELIDELLGFPGTRHDDQVDSLTQAIRWNKRQPPPMTFHPPFVFSVPRNFP